MTAVSRLRRPRVVERDRKDTLILRPGYVQIVAYTLLGLGTLVASGVLIAYGRSSTGVVAGGLVIGSGALILAAFIAFARDPLLTVDTDGVSAPLFSAGIGLLPWSRIARIYRLYVWGNGLAVDVWRDPDDHDAGTKLGLFVPAGMWPITVSRVLREIDRRSPD